MSVAIIIFTLYLITILKWLVLLAVVYWILMIVVRPIMNIFS